MNITIEPWQNHLRKGRKAIMVDGVRWGVIEMDSHGVHGASYWFRQEAGEAIYEPCKNFRGEDSTRLVKVWGNKHHKYNPQPAAPVEQRLIETAARLIEQKLLCHPDTMRALIALRQKQERETRAMYEEIERKEWEAKAVEAFDRHNVTAIIEAMKWAQMR